MHEDFLIISDIDWQLTSTPINRRIIPGRGRVVGEEEGGCPFVTHRERERKKKVNLFFQRLPTVIAPGSVWLFGKSCKLERRLDGRCCEEQELTHIGWNRNKERKWRKDNRMRKQMVWKEIVARQRFLHQGSRDTWQFCWVLLFDCTIWGDMVPQKTPTGSNFFFF